MVNYSLNLDTIFSSLSHPTRRDILRRVGQGELTPSQLVEAYDITPAAMTKHLTVLEKAKLIIRRKKGRERFVRLSPVAMKEAADYLEFYRQYWEQQLDALELYLSKNTKP